MRRQGWGGWALCSGRSPCSSRPRDRLRQSPLGSCALDLGSTVENLCPADVQHSTHTVDDVRSHHINLSVTVFPNLKHCCLLTFCRGNQGLEVICGGHSMPWGSVNAHFQRYLAVKLNFDLYPQALPLFIYFTLDINKSQ